MTKLVIYHRIDERKPWCWALYQIHKNVKQKREIGTFILNKPADAGVLSRVNSPVNCKEAVHTARITEGVEEHG